MNKSRMKIRKQIFTKLANDDSQKEPAWLEKFRRDGQVSYLEGDDFIGIGFYKNNGLNEMAAHDRALSQARKAFERGYLRHNNYSPNDYAIEFGYDPSEERIMFYLDKKNETHYYLFSTKDFTVIKKEDQMKGKPVC